MSETPKALYEQVRRHAQETGLLSSVEALLGWDERTQLPPAGGEHRAEQMTLLSGLLHRRHTDPKLGELLEELSASPLAAEADSETGATIRQLKRQFDRKSRLPQSLVEELTRTAVLGQQAWVDARKKSDFASFRPWLEKTFELKRQEAEALGYRECRYDALLDDYEPGESTAPLAAVLAALRDELIGMAGAIRDCDRRPDGSLLRREFPVPAQREFGRQAAARIGFDFSRGRLDETVHPFCCEAGPHDCRITTRYDERFFPSAFFGTLHEAGHGLYEQGLPPHSYGLPLGQYASMGIHESQSRMWENPVGRSEAFWRHFYPLAQREFPTALANVPRESFLFAINDVRPSLIRVEADEVTYNLHIIIRFELEQALLAGDLPVADLPAVWSDKYREYLGIVPANDAEGVLQDVHWSAGLVGYFPTYALGNLYAAQFFAQAERDLGSLTEQFAAGEFQPLLRWLREKIHAHGRRYSASRLVQRVTGRELSHTDLINYLLNKLEPLYSGPAAGSQAAGQAPPTAASGRPTELSPSVAVAEAVSADATVAREVADGALNGQLSAPPLSSREANLHAAAVPWPGPVDEAFDEPLGESFDAAAAFSASSRAQPHRIGFWGNLAGFIIFSVGGLGLGYWLLNYFGGPRFDFLHIWLPLVEHAQ